MDHPGSDSGSSSAAAARPRTQSGHKSVTIDEPSQTSTSTHRARTNTSNNRGSEKDRAKIKSHSIHGMGEDERGSRPHKEMGALSFEEKKFLLAVERGDVASTRRMLAELGREGLLLDINCCDPLGRSALVMAIDNENLEMVELLLDNKVETKDALLHAIHEEYVEAVDVLLEHEDTIHKEGEPHSWEAVPAETATFTRDITPLVLAAHRDNYEILRILLDRGYTLPIPHDVRCGCEECMTSRQEDSLRHSRSRINAYRALASPSLIALSSKDPILTAFELSWELRRLAFLEHEFKTEYLELRNQCQRFATALLDHTRSSYELEVLLNHDPAWPVYQHGERMHLNRLKLAIKYRQKKFVAHPNVQQLLASIWYEGLPGFRQMNMILQFLEVCRIGLLFPFFSLSYIICPWTDFSQKIRKPFIKFICNAASYFTFLFLLILASQRIEKVIAEWFANDRLKEWLSNDVTTMRGSTPTLVEWCILAWVAGLIWSEIKQLWDVGLKEYANDMWNVIDFVTNSLYVATVALRLVAYYKVQEEIRVGSATAYLPREQWDTWDPMLISEGLFAAANIFSNLKLVYIFSVNPYLGPLQVSLSRMVMDILKFISLFVLVLFAFSCGCNQLLWYYADLEKQRCYLDQAGLYGELPPSMGGMGGSMGMQAHLQAEASANYTVYGPHNRIIDHDINHCLAWRRFANLWETSQTLFWAIFGLIDLDNFELTGIKEFTRFFGLFMFGSFSVINIIVLLNLLIAMMNHSYQLISVSSEKADTEWKFARSKLWISYFEEGGTVPPPFNIIPTPKSIFYFFRWAFNKMCGRRSTVKKEHLKTKKVRQASERDLKYQAIMRNLVRRYVTQEQRKAENEGVTEDDVNEIKNDISAFRFELIEIMRQSGMNVSSVTSHMGAAGKKNRQKERRLIKGFNLSAPGLGTSLAATASVTPTSTHSANGGQYSVLGETVAEISAEAEDFRAANRRTPLTKLVRLAKLASANRDSQQSDPLSFSLADAESVRLAREAGQTAQAETSRSRILHAKAASVRGKRKDPAVQVGAGAAARNMFKRLASASSSPDELHTVETHNQISCGSPPGDLCSMGGSRREKFGRARSAVQCLNPTQLQEPYSTAKARQHVIDLQVVDADVVVTAGQAAASEADDLGADDGTRRFLQRTFRVDMTEDAVEEEEDSSEAAAAGDADAEAAKALNGAMIERAMPGLKTSKNSSSGWI